MLILIIGRWMLPKGDLTRDQLSQLLLVYIGTAADIIEFFDSFKEDKIARETVLVYLTLGIWSWSLMQFTVVLTATKSRKSRLSSGTTIRKKVTSETSCCSIDVWGIALNMLLQDGPFLAFRLILIIHYQIVSYMNIFFTCKNTLVILLQLYRLYVVQSESKHRRDKRKQRRDANHYEMPSISIVSRSDMYKQTRGKIIADDRRRKHRKIRDIEAHFSESEESTEEVDRYEELSPKNLERSKRKTRQDTGYSTSSSRNSSKQDKSQKRENKKNSTRRENEKREALSEDEKRNGKKKTEKKSNGKKEKRSSDSGNKNSVRIRNEDGSKTRKRSKEESEDESSSEASIEDSKSRSECSEFESQTKRYTL